MRTVFNGLSRKSVFRILLLLALLAGLLAVTVRPAAGSPARQIGAECELVFNPVPPPGTFTQVCSGGGGGGTIIIPPGGGGASCTPGTTAVGTIVVGGGGLCEVWTVWYDTCTGQITYSVLVDILDGGSCSASPPSGPPFNPCVTLVITGGGVYCQTDWGLEWLLEANVSFPDTFLDLRPYPATLVRWPSAARNGGTPPAAGSGTLDYIAYGGGEEDEPEVGDWRDVRLTLRLAPATPIIFFTMPQIGTLALPDVGPNGAPIVFQFELPSHPEAGGSVLAGGVQGLGELPADIPLFSGSATSAYRLFWSLSYEKYVKDCRPGPDPVSGTFTCKTKNSEPVDDGHWEYEWDRRGQGGEITPEMVIGLPPGMAADLDGDGSPDAYWNSRVTIRRMDDAGRIDNPLWQASWSWGGAVYWAVREGQGQIGWP